eukprot:m.84027 g.84027  ORF g.84027 m.84027 type:complete len:952 (+) comp21167_c0_seq1:84-2939(+)
MGDRAGTGVKVVIRFRPQNNNENSHGGRVIARFDPSGKSMSMAGSKPAAFTFDKVFDTNTTQQEVYNYTARPIVEDVLQGYNGTIFAYGQTSSGKTHTMEGPSIDGPNKGVIPRIVFNIFEYIEAAPEHLEFTVRVSYFEIYMEKIKDLLCDGSDNLQVHENPDRGVYVRHATELFMQSPEEVLEVMRSGAQRRSVASTNMNDQSSRSHSVFLMEIGQRDVIKGGVKTGKLYLVDLAGSEKVSKTGADGETLEEAKIINKSLSALGLVIMSLTNGTSGSHVPYRDSKLTRILQDSLGGNCRTTIIICCSPSSFNESETLSSLRFGQRAKKIKNKAVMNIQYSAEELQKKLDQATKTIRKLERRLNSAIDELKIWRSGGTVSEEDRVKLDGSGNPNDVPTNAADPDTIPIASLPSGVSEQEKAEMMQRETELLDLLDEKDKEIEVLKDEINNLSSERVAFSKLAAEHAYQSEKLAKTEEKVRELTEESKEYDIALDEITRHNEDLDAQIQRKEEEFEALTKEHEDAMLQNRLQLTGLAEVIASISSETFKTPESGTVVDAQINKAFAYVTRVRGDMNKLKATKEELEEHRAKVDASMAELEKKLKTSKAETAATEKRLEESNEHTDSLQKKIEKQNEEISRLQDKTTELLGQIVASSEKEEQNKVDEVKAALEAQHNEQREQQNKQMADLREQAETLRKVRDEITAEKDRLQVELVQAKADLDQLKEQNDKHNKEITSLKQTTEEKEAIKKEVLSVTTASEKQLESFKVLKAKYRENILARVRKRTATGKENEQTEAKKSKQVEHLEKENKKLVQTTHAAQKEQAELKRDLATAEKALTAKNARIKNLEQLMKSQEEKLGHLAAENNKLRHSRHTVQPVIRKRASLRGGQQKTVIRRGSAQSNDPNGKAAGFWNKNPQQQKTEARPADSVPAQPAQPVKPNNNVDPLTVEYV